MLVLSRKPGETITIGKNIVVKIYAIRGRHVRIGIEAPKDQLILRSEVADREEGQGDGK